MHQLTPRRCPFLEGTIGSKMFGGIKKKDRRVDFQCDLLGLCFSLCSDVPDKYGCLNGEYSLCPHYTRRALELAVTIPLTCPLKREETDECTVTNKVCSRYWINLFDSWAEDYRDCEVFAKWFWSTRIGQCLGTHDLKKAQM